MRRGHHHHRRLENIELIEDPARTFVVIMKDGILYKNLAQ
jgi:hypothetical protein